MNQDSLFPDVEQKPKASDTASPQIAKPVRTRRTRPNPDVGGDTLIFQLKITLMEIRPPIWRRVFVPGSIPLQKLHRVIQCAMGWDNQHLFEFRFKKKRTSLEEDIAQFADPWKCPLKAKTLAGYVRARGSKFRYVYDFGDSWEHEILLEKIVSRENAAALPLCLGGERSCPPEDCGGIYGFLELLEAAGNPRHPRHEDVLDWLGDDFDPERFDLKAVNARMKRIRI